MSTTSAAEKAGGEKEKVEKRRALGRGLEALFRGPRVVAPPTVPPPAGGSGNAPLHSGEAASGQQAGDGGAAPATVASIQAVVEEEGRGAGSSAAATETRIPHFVRDDSALSDGVVHRQVELRPTGQPGAAVPTQDFPHETISIQASAAEGRVPSNLVVSIELDLIDKNPYQTRYAFDDETLEELADSIRVQGVVQPIVVRPGEDGRYVLILGERRCRASRLAGKTTIPAIVKRVSTQQAAEMTIVENLQRQDLNCIEQAEAFRVLSRDFNLTQAQIGERVGMSRESVSNYMRLLKLTQPTMEHVLAGRIGFSEARELLKLEDPLRIEQAAEKVVKEQMKWEQIETMVARMTGWLDPVPGLPGEVKKKTGARWVDPNVRAAQVELERLLQVRVRIKDRKGKGKIIIEYSTVDDYERVVEALKGKKK